MIAVLLRADEFLGGNANSLPLCVSPGQSSKEIGTRQEDVIATGILVTFGQAEAILPESVGNSETSEFHEFFITRPALRTLPA